MGTRRKANPSSVRRWWRNQAIYFLKGTGRYPLRYDEYGERIARMLYDLGLDKRSLYEAAPWFHMTAAERDYVDQHRPTYWDGELIGRVLGLMFADKTRLGRAKLRNLVAIDENEEYVVTIKRRRELAKYCRYNAKRPAKRKIKPTVKEDAKAMWFGKMSPREQAIYLAVEDDWLTNIEIATKLAINCKAVYRATKKLAAAGAIALKMERKPFDVIKVRLLMKGDDRPAKDKNPTTHREIHQDSRQDIVRRRTSAEPPTERTLMLLGFSVLLVPRFRVNHLLLLGAIVGGRREIAAYGV